MTIDAVTRRPVISRLCHQLIGIAGRVNKPPYFGIPVAIRFQIDTCLACDAADESHRSV